MRRIRLNSLQLNAVTINSAGERWRDSHAGAPPVVPDVPDIPDIPEEPDVPSDPDVDENGYIIFADPEVKRVLLANDVGDGVGITKEAAAEVTSIGAWFKGNTTIENFDEFEKFTGVTFLGTSTDNYTLGAFVGCSSLKTITLPSSITTLRNGAFKDCISLYAIGRLDNVVEIRPYVFYGCNSLSLDIDLPKATHISVAAFANTRITSINCEHLKSTGDSSDNFNFGTFAFCSNLQNVNMPRIETLGGNTFSNCTSLRKIILPESLTAIQARAFYKCSGLLTAVFNSDVPPSCSWGVFEGATSCTIYVPDASVSAYREATNWSTYASRIFPISQLSSDNPDLYNEIKDYL
jgi:hypothetical protein